MSRTAAARYDRRGRRRSSLRSLYRWAAALRLPPPRHGAWRGHDRALRRLLAEAPEAPATWHWIFRYLLTGFLEWRSPGGAQAHYPGLPSRTPDSDGLEGFARFLPLAAAWLAGGRPGRVRDLGEREIDLPALLAEGLANGSDPAHPEFWGQCHPRNQRQVEAADVALGFWLARAQLWPLLDGAARARLGAWLAGASAGAVWDGNWHLFPPLINAVLAALGLPAARGDDAAHLARVRALHLGQGWFCDGEPWQVDHYNAWAFHYALPWLARIEPGADAGLVEATLPDFAASLAALISPRGVPLLGRSLTYRLALPGPLIAAQRLWPRRVAPGLARRALAATWRHYGLRGALRAGQVTQGVEGAWLPLLDAYSGAASPLWSARALVLALAEPEAAPFWTDAPRPLPVEQGDYELALPGPGWRVTGRQASGEVVIHRLGEARPARFDGGGLALAWRVLRRQPRRPPGNRDSRYFQASYSNLRPFWR